MSEDRPRGFDTAPPDDALLYAASTGRIEEIHAALARGANIEARGIGELTPLMMALSHRRIEAARFLIISLLSCHALDRFPLVAPSFCCLSLD
jgi:ankyrin repeat protein